jgi:anaerobic glycerol-3-phosphate dehydrogenase
MISTQTHNTVDRIASQKKTDIPMSAGMPVVATGELSDNDL